jgi:6-phosphogluconolactonase
MRAEPRYFPSLAQMSQWAADFVCDLARKSIGDRGLFTMVLSGGKTPRPLYANLATPPFRESMPWSRTHLFWGDERCVPPHHPDSNFLAAHDLMTSRVPIDPSHIHRIRGELRPPEKAALEYEGQLRKFFDLPEGMGGSKAGPGTGDRIPSFDLILLGMGPDGHTASLFPSDRAIEEKTRWVVAVDGSQGSPAIPRITMTLPLINACRSVIVLVAGSEKEHVVRALLDEPEEAGATYPVAMVRPRGRVLLLHVYGALARARRPDE